MLWSDSARIWANRRSLLEPRSGVWLRLEMSVPYPACGEPDRSDRSRQTSATQLPFSSGRETPLVCFTDVVSSRRQPAGAGTPRIGGAQGFSISISSWLEIWCGAVRSSRFPIPACTSGRSPWCRPPSSCLLGPPTLWSNHRRACRGGEKRRSRRAHLERAVLDRARISAAVKVRPNHRI